MSFSKNLPLIGCLISGAALGFVACLLLNQEGGRRVQAWEQAPYRADLCEGRKIWAPFDHRHREHRLWIGRRENPPCEGYGHEILWRFAEDGKTYLEKVALNWTTEGAEMSEPDGHRVFIPKEAFIGGR